MKKIIILMMFVCSCYAKILTADTQTQDYLPLLKNKKVAVFANAKSMVNDKVNIVDVLLKSKVNLVKVFSPEHGFSGQADAGADVDNTKYHGVNVTSLYGSKNMPSVTDLQNVDVVVFDLQDVGVRYYTYLSSLQKMMEAILRDNKQLVVLDRPNPNGFYVDGPILQESYHSFVGLQPIPIVYGMTIGEYANMLKGESWLDTKKDASKLNMVIIKNKNYTHDSKYQLQQMPSPNLPNMQAIYNYPSLGWFEGTGMSVGRGTNTQFQVLGSPLTKGKKYIFMPKPNAGASDPKYNNEKCYGSNLTEHYYSQPKGQIDLTLLIDAYKNYKQQYKFFTSFFKKLSGNDILSKQIIQGMSIKQIRNSWESDLTKFKQIRKKYLLYKDFTK